VCPLMTPNCAALDLYDIFRHILYIAHEFT
jgi:hypothetical protein